MKRTVVAAALAAALATLAPAPSAAQSSGESVEQVRATLISLIRALVDQGVLTVAKAQEMLRQAGLDPALLAATPVTPVPPAPPAAQAKPPVRVPYVPEVVKQELREEIKQEVLAQARAERWADPGALPEWLSRFTFYGDVRLRWQTDRFDDSNDSVQLIDAFYQLPQGSTRNATQNRDRMRVRARLGTDVRLADEFRAGARITTDDGSGNPTSTNADLGRYQQRFATTWDLAFLQWDYSPLGHVYGGRIQNPYGVSDLLFASDLTLDGVAVTYKPRFGLAWQGNATAGVHPMREVEGGPLNTAQDQWLYAAQLGATWTAIDSSSLSFGLGWFDFVHAAGELNPEQPSGNTFNAQQAPVFRRRGNTMFNLNALSSPGGAAAFAPASKFRVAVANVNYELARFDPIRLGVSAEYVRNFGFKESEIRDRIGIAINELPQDITGRNGVERRRTKGYRYGVQVGNAELLRFGHWQAFAGYRYLERDAVLDGLTSTDYRLGGTDQKAYFLGANLGLAPRVSMTLRYVSARSLDAAVKYDVDSWFLDFNGRF